VYEYQVVASMAAVYLDRGCERGAYAPMVTSGPNGVFLHYEINKRRMETGDLLLMDVGAECAGYAADVTRTIPVDGHFTPRQLELYNAVLGAQRAVIELVKPGVTIGRDTPNSLQNVAMAYLNSHGHDLHGRPLGKYFTHGISHHIGLEVHDPADLTAPLEEGNVISVEPGLYIPEEGIGIRIEDMVLVTHDGSRVLSTALPKDAAEIERRMAR
jgi:Xaa-Pro aminopeptidase